MKSNERFRWTLKVLQIQPDDEVLEIGCGTGLAAGMVSESLGSGRITAIDKSDTMITKAKSLVSSDKVRFLTGRLGRLKLPQNHFSKAFAFNVGSFWKAEAIKDLEVLRAHLKSTGVFYLFHQPPSSDKTKMIAEKSIVFLEKAGYEVGEVLFEDFDSATASCIVSRPSKLKIPKKK